LKTENRKQNKTEKRGKLTWPQPNPAGLASQPTRGLAWIPFRYPTDKRDPLGENPSFSSIRRKLLAVELRRVADAKIRAIALDALYNDVRRHQKP
jgi:hypothetical protein